MPAPSSDRFNIGILQASTLWRFVGAKPSKVHIAIAPIDFADAAKNPKFHYRFGVGVIRA